MQYKAWEIMTPRGGCVLGSPRNFPGLLDMVRGRSGALASTHPTDVELHMDPTFPKDIKLYDQISNLERLLVCSPKLRDFIQSLELPSVETLPVTIFDHKGKVASDEYSIINPYSVQDCIDQQASMFDWNPIDTDLICGMYELVLDHEKIDPAIPVFRPKHFAQFTFIREDIADAIVKQGFQGPVMSSFDGWAR